MFDDKLELAPTLIERNPATQADRIAVAGVKAQALVAVAEHGATDLGTAILQGEIPVPGGGRNEIADLTRDPDKIEMALQQCPGLPVELAHSKRRWRVSRAGA